MNWKKEAENDLRNYERRLQSLQNTAEKIRALREQMLSIRGGISDSAPVQGGSSSAQDRMIDCIAEIERLGHTRAATARLVRLVERGLDSLSEQDRRVLELFYIHRSPGHVERLMDELHLEQAQVYRVKDAALYRFTAAVYGIIDY